MPPLAVADGTVLAVDVTFTVDTVATELPEAVPGSKRSFGVAVGQNGELARVHLMVRYSSSPGTSPTSCGCNALPAYPNRVCDQNMVCGVNPYPVVDCAGQPFGRAIVDDCGTCAGGVTGRSVQLGGTCTGVDGADSSANNPTLRTASQTDPSYELEVILVAVIACALSCSLLGVMFCLRRYLLWRMGMLAAQDDHSLAGEMVAAAAGAGGTTAAAPRGLTEAERAALQRRVFDASVRCECRDGPRPDAALVGGDGVFGGGDGGSHGGGGGDGLEKGHVPEHVAGAAQSADCSICLAEFQEGASVTILPAPCGHLFHAACIDHWFENSTTCPLCKRSIRDIIAAKSNATDSVVAVGTAPGVGDTVFPGTVAGPPSLQPPLQPPLPPLLLPLQPLTTTQANPAPPRRGYFALFAPSAAYQPTSRLETDSSASATADP